MVLAIHMLQEAILGGASVSVTSHFTDTTIQVPHLLGRSPYTRVEYVSASGPAAGKGSNGDRCLLQTTGQSRLTSQGEATTLYLDGVTAASTMPPEVRLGYNELGVDTAKPSDTWAVQLAWLYWPLVSDTKEFHKVLGPHLTTTLDMLYRTYPDLSLWITLNSILSIAASDDPDGVYTGPRISKSELPGVTGAFQILRECMFDERFGLDISYSAIADTSQYLLVRAGENVIVKPGFNPMNLPWDMKTTRFLMALAHDLNIPVLTDENLKVIRATPQFRAYIKNSFIAKRNNGVPVCDGSKDFFSHRNLMSIRNDAGRHVTQVEGGDLVGTAVLGDGIIYHLAGVTKGDAQAELGRIIKQVVFGDPGNLYQLLDYCREEQHATWLKMLSMNYLYRERESDDVTVSSLRLSNYQEHAFKQLLFY